MKILFLFIYSAIQIFDFVFALMREKLEVSEIVLRAVMVVGLPVLILAF